MRSLYTLLEMTTLIFLACCHLPSKTLTMTSRSQTSAFTLGKAAFFRDHAIPSIHLSFPLEGHLLILSSLGQVWHTSQRNWNCGYLPPSHTFRRPIVQATSRDLWAHKPLTWAVILMTSDISSGCNIVSPCSSTLKKPLL